ncbi:hypothetical protein ACKGJY_10960 [Hyunsoonleella sp. 2307UL5-6]|uniref:hypothetical protein n=1 Tax=Hyunsoonleella sp. 2307UL5-6 TaxID=3384768 RepID=UPI0039BC625B
MNLKELSNFYLKWENENDLYNYKINNFPIYVFFRMQFYHCFLFGNDVVEELSKEGLGSVKKVNKKKVLINSLLFFFNLKKLKKNNLIISNTSNRKNVNGYYKDIMFDNICDFKLKDYAILEFPQLGTYHYNQSYKKENIVYGDFLYLAERFVKPKINLKDAEVIIEIIIDNFALFWEKYHSRKFDKSLLKTELLLKLKRNISRIPIYKKLLAYVKPKAIYLKAGYAPQSQIITQISKELNIDIVEVQHGHIYSLHGGYTLPKEKNKGFFPNYLAVWSNYYKNIVINNGWDKNSVKVFGDFTQIKDINDIDVFKTLKPKDVLKKIVNNHKYIVTVVCQHSIEGVFSNFLKQIKTIEKRNIGVILKLHPRLQEKQTLFFKHILKDFDNIYVIGNTDIKECFNVSNLVVGVYSTALIEALEYGLPVHLIDCKESQFLDDLLKLNLVRLSGGIDESYKILSEDNHNLRTCVFREKFNFF